MNWKRTLVWSAVIFSAALAVGLALESDVASHAGIFVSSTILYYGFLRPLQDVRIRHGIAAFLLVETMDWLIPLMLGAPLSWLLANWDATARHLGAAAVGLAIAWVGSNNSSKPTPLRGAA